MTLGPYHINQPPDFLIRSNEEKDVIMRVITVAEGMESPWHTHPGPSFVIVSQGEVKLTRFAKVRGHHQCVEQFFGPGEGFVEVADEVHKASNVGEGDVVLHITRLNIPVGAPDTDTSPNLDPPDC
jgi:quercetin dioxygenase-like cupin family protein